MHLRTAMIITVAVLLFAPVTLNADSEDFARAAMKSMKSRFSQNEIEVERLWGGYTKVNGHLKDAGKISPEVAPVEALFQEAYAASERGEARRQIHQAWNLMLKQAWTPLDDFKHSLILKTDMTVCDPGYPMIARIEQLYPSSYKESSPLRMRITLRKANAPRRSKPFKVFSVHESPLVTSDQPFYFAADLTDVKEGNYKLSVEVYAGEEPLRRIMTPIYLVAGLMAKHKAVEERLEAIEGHDNTKATIRYPFDFALKVNLMKMPPVGYNIQQGLIEGEQLLKALEEEDKDPRIGGTGDQRRHYWFEEAGEVMPYRVFVPSSYDGKQALPMILALHGGSGTENTMIGGSDSIMKQQAEQHGYIVVAPLGYRPHGGYGRPFDESTFPAASRRSPLSEKDVMNVLALVRAEYKIDEKRIYLMGHSMGGNGTWLLGSKYADIWAALAPISSGQVTPDGVTEREVQSSEAASGNLPSKGYDFDSIKHLPVFICHGAIDPRALVENARAMYARMKELGMTCEYFEKPDGTHAMTKVSLPKIFKFFNEH